jgi:hypothetical protein
LNDAVSSSWDHTNQGLTSPQRPQPSFDLAPFSPLPPETRKTIQRIVHPAVSPEFVL